MRGAYLEAHEMDQLEELLKHCMEDTISCWKRTRINNISASLACDGNVSIPLLRAFDKIYSYKKE